MQPSHCPVPSYNVRLQLSQPLSRHLPKVEHLVWPAGSQALRAKASSRFAHTWTCVIREASQSFVASFVRQRSLYASESFDEPAQRLYACGDGCETATTDHVGTDSLPSVPWSNTVRSFRSSSVSYRGLHLGFPRTSSCD